MVTDRDSKKVTLKKLVGEDFSPMDCVKVSMPGRDALWL